MCTNILTKHINSKKKIHDELFVSNAVFGLYTPGTFNPITIKRAYKIVDENIALGFKMQM